jgi:hypothetical protein
MNKILLTGILWLAFPGWGNQAQGQLQINASATEICINESVEFTSSSSTTIDEWDWDFGPGASPDESDDDDPEVSYSSPGMKTIKLKVEYDEDTEDQDQAQVQIMVFAESVGGEVKGGTTPILLGESTGTMSLSGEKGEVQHWEKSLNSGDYDLIASASGTSYSEQPSSSGEWRYLAVVKNGACAEVESSSKLIVVQQASAGTLSGGNGTICQGSSTGTMTLSDYTGTIEAWQIKTGDDEFKDLNPSNTEQETYSTSDLPVGSHLFQVKVSSGSETFYSNTVSIIVDATSVGGSVGGGATPIYLGENTGTMTLSGHTGVVQKWEKSLNSGPYTDILSATGLTYSEAPSSAGDWRYRAVVKSGVCPVANSTERTIVVQEASAGTITGGNSPICEGSSTGTMTLSDYTGTIEAWEIKTGSGNFTGIDGTAGKSFYSADELPAGTHEFRVRIMAVTEIYSNTRTIVVDAATVAGTVSGEATVCEGTNSTKLTLSGNNGAVLTWRISTNGSLFNDIDGTTGLEYTAANLTTDRWYRVRVKNGACPTANSNIVKVTVNPKPAAAGSISGPGSVTQGDEEVDYSVGTISNATSYLWTVPPGFDIVQGMNTRAIKVDVSLAAESGDLTVKGVNDCGEGAATVMPLSLNKVPKVTSATYNAGTGVLSITGSDFNTGSDVDPSKITIGERCAGVHAYYCHSKGGADQCYSGEYPVAWTRQGSRERGVE